MPEFAAFYVRVLLALVAICDPLGNMPIFVSLTSGASRPDPRATARATAVAVFIVFAVFAVVGEGLLTFFSIRMASFRIAGGILLLLMGINMLRATPGPIRGTDEAATEGARREQIAVVPMAIPLLSGPGAMTTVIVYAHQATTGAKVAAQFAAYVTTAVIIYVALRAAVPVLHRFGQTGVNIVTRVMGLVVVAIGVEFMTVGLGEIFPVLLSGS